LLARERHNQGLVVPFLMGVSWCDSWSKVGSYYVGFEILVGFKNIGVFV